MRVLRLVLLTVLGVWLEVSFLGAWRPFGIVPNLFLVIILIAAATLSKASDTLAMAVGGGILLDLVSGADFGLRTAFFSFLALLVIVVRRTGADFDHLSMKLAGVAGGTLLYSVTIIISLLGQGTHIGWAVAAGRVGVELVLNLVLTLLLDVPLHRLLETKAGSVPVIGQ